MNQPDELNKILASLAAATDLKALYEIKVAFGAKDGFFNQMKLEMGKLPKEQKPEFGKQINQIKTQFESAYVNGEERLREKEINDKVKRDAVDVSLPGPILDKGAKHPIHMIFDEAIAILSRIGFTVRTGPQIEKDWYNFEALNIPPDHPARDMQDTFYIDDEHVLRTHTSPVQIHTLLTEKPPFRALAPGAVYRCDSDISHSPNFHQIEGLLVDHKVSMAELKGTITFVLSEMFGSAIKVRFRPSFFPFTEPSAEFDCSCPVCAQKGCRLCKFSGWIEIGGSGLVNPRVFEAVKLDPKVWQGFAFGFGIERMAIIKYGIDDIRLFFENDLRFVRQFSV